MSEKIRFFIFILLLLFFFYKQFPIQQLDKTKIPRYINNNEENTSSAQGHKQYIHKTWTLNPSPLKPEGYQEAKVDRKNARTNTPTNRKKQLKKDNAKLNHI